MDEVTPETSMAIMPDYRNKGYDTELLRRFFELAKKGFIKLSSSIGKRNRAVKLYKRAGFKVIAGSGDDYIMELEL